MLSHTFRYIAITLFMVIAVACGLVSASELTISYEHNVFPGGLATVSVTASQVEVPLSGFNLAIVLDQHQYGLVNVLSGASIQDCDWEYFGYRIFRQDSIPEYDLRGATHLLTVTALASVTEGYEPTCDLSGSDLELVTLDFLIDYETRYPYFPVTCTFQTVNFYWRDCQDNLLYTADGVTALAVDVTVDPTSMDTVNIEGFSVPSGGCPELEPLVYDRSLLATNGGMEIVCTDEWFQSRGDINLNGRPFETADLVMYNCVLMWGLVCFDINPDEQIIQSDVNDDGYPLTIADMVYTAVIIMNHIMPSSYPTGFSGTASFDSEMSMSGQAIDLELSEPAAAIYVRLANTDLHQDQLSGVEPDNVSIGRIGEITTLLIINPETIETVLKAGRHRLINDLPKEASIVSIEIVNRYGQSMIVSPGAAVLPDSPQLNRNYPNPFNPSTTISFTLPCPSDWTLTVFDITGRYVRQFDGAGQGLIELVWDGADHHHQPVASGIYFYRLKTDNLVCSRKMLLLK